MNKDKKMPLGFTVAQWRLFFTILIIGGAGLFYHALRFKGVENSAALYIGLPFLLALGLSLTPKAKTSIGSTMKGLTIAIFLSAPLLMEGFLCILMASPILYSIAALFTLAVDRVKKSGDGNSKIQLAALSMVLAVASFEGTHESLSFERYNQVEYSRVVSADIETLRKNLSKPLVQAQNRPLLLRVFPLPISSTGQGLNVGDERRLDFIYKKWIFANAHEGSTIFRITETKDDYIRFSIPHDDSYISHYLTWESSEVFFEPVGNGETKVTWRLSYERKLDPMWYFDPLQSYAARLTAKALIDNVTNPAI